MSNFIAFVACQLAVCGKYLDNLDVETRAQQRAVARACLDQTTRNLREIALTARGTRRAISASIRLTWQASR